MKGVYTGSRLCGTIVNEMTPRTRLPISLSLCLPVCYLGRPYLRTPTIYSLAMRPRATSNLSNFLLIMSVSPNDGATVFCNDVLFPVYHTYIQHRMSLFWFREPTLHCFRNSPL